MTAKDLKNALLREAVQGKLVPQIASEGNARDLLEEIKRSRHSELVSESKNKAKKEKPLPEITEEDIPFDIPENWCWCRLGNLAEIKSSKRVFEKDYVNDGIPFFRSKEIGDLSRGELIHTELFISKKHYEELKKNYGVPKINDILLTSVGSIGNNWICDGRDFYYKDGNVTQICSNDFYDPNFLTSFLSSPLFFEQVNSSVSGTAYNALTIIKLKSLIFPLPPLAEQKRIVAAIEKFMPLIEEYGKKETELKAFNEQIGTFTKKAILQEAVQGKLVPQIATEGNAKDLLEEIRKERLSHGLDFAYAKSGKRKSKKETALAGSNPCDISDDEIPFDIPENWCWCRLGEITEITMGQSPEGINVGETVQGMEFHQGKIFFTDKIIGKSNQQTSEITKIAKENSILLCMRAPVGKINITDREICIGRGLSSIIPFFNVDTMFLYYLLETLESDFNKKATGSTFKAITGDIVRNQAIPLPPLAEQKRIVAAIEKMLPLCDKLGV